MLRNLVLLYMYVIASLQSMLMTMAVVIDRYDFQYLGETLVFLFYLDALVTLLEHGKIYFSFTFMDPFFASLIKSISFFTSVEILFSFKLILLTLKI